MSGTKIPKNIAKNQLMEASRTSWGKAERTLQNRARDLDTDVTAEVLAELLKPWK